MTQHEFDILLEANAPHPVLRKDWSMYYPRQFADAFLPKAHLIKGKAMIVYDGAELFKNVSPAAPDYFQLTDSNNLITMVICTYPKGVEAQLKRDRVQPIGHEVLLFMELDVDENIEMHFRFGRDFRTFLSDQRAPIYGMENTVYRTTLDKLHQSLANGTTA